MDLLDITRRQTPPPPWAEGEKIPWSDPDFSKRMLCEHLSQEHDAASRRSETIDHHVAWIHRHILSGRPTSILDLGCGPGLYASRLAKLGHSCHGIDFGPASIAYARRQAEQASLGCHFTLADIRHACFGTGYGLAIWVYGEFNVFTRSDAAMILRKIWASLDDGGLLLVEPHTLVAVEQLGGRTWWQASQRGLFSERPHVLLYESAWDGARSTTTERYYVIDAATGVVTRHASTMQAYTDDEYEALLAECGFGSVQFLPSLCGEIDESQGSLFALVAAKAETAPQPTR